MHSQLNQSCALLTLFQTKYLYKARWKILPLPVLKLLVDDQQITELFSD